MHQDRTANHKGLSRFETVDSGVDINRIGTKDSQHAHVEQVQIARLNDGTIGVCINDDKVVEEVTKQGGCSMFPQERSELHGYDNGSTAVVTAQEWQ